MYLPSWNGLKGLGAHRIDDEPVTSFVACHLFDAQAESPLFDAQAESPLFDAQVESPLSVFLTCLFYYCVPLNTDRKQKAEVICLFVQKIRLIKSQYRMEKT